MRAMRWVAAACLAAATAAPGALSWDESATVDGVRWTVHVVRRGEIELGSDQKGKRALDAEVEGVLVIPRELAGKSVTRIGNHAFAGMEGITEVVFPDGLKNIGGEAFAGCTSLQRVVVPDSVSDMGDRAFAGCISLKEIVLGTNLWHLNERAFEGCISLERVEMRDQGRGLRLGARAFADCTGLKQVDIPSRCESMGEEAFAGCTGLHEVVIQGRGPCASLGMGRRAFADCNHLERVTWERSGCFVLEIRREDIPGCISSFRPVYARPGDAIDTFEGCTGIREVAINAVWPGQLGLAAVFPDAFGEIRRVTILDGSPHVPEGLFRGCAKLEEVVLPDSVTAIGADAFDGCDSLKSVKWPAGLREVDPNALRGASIEEGPTVASGRPEDGAAETGEKH